MDESVRDRGMNDENIFAASAIAASPVREGPPITGATRRVKSDAWLRIQSWWQRIWRLRRRPARRLRLAESLALGERRFVAVIEFEQRRFLVGGTSTSVVLLARLGTNAEPASSRRPQRHALENNRPERSQEDGL